MLDWLIETGTWIKSLWLFFALIIGFMLFAIIRRNGDRIIKRIIPMQLYEQMGEKTKVFKYVLLGISGIIIVFLITSFGLATFGVDLTPMLIGISNWLLEHGVRIVIIVIVGYLLQTVAKVLLPVIVRRSISTTAKNHRAEEELQKRTQTLSRLFVQTLEVIIVITIIFMILSEIDIDIAPLLAGAGVAGIAIGFGAQSLIKDLINGVFIIAENQYNYGDVVKIANISGLVESINLRRTILRDLDGIVHSIPNGEITSSSNFTREWSRVNMNVSVSYREDLDHCIKVINKVGAELGKDPVFGPMIINAPKVLRVDNFGDSGIEIKITGETKPIKQWDVMGELRRRLKIAFDEEGIEIPWRHTKIYFGDEALLNWLSKNEANGKTDN